MCQNRIAHKCAGRAPNNDPLILSNPLHGDGRAQPNPTWRNPNSVTYTLKIGEISITLPFRLGPYKVFNLYHRYDKQGMSSTFSQCSFASDTHLKSFMRLLIEQTKKSASRGTHKYAILTDYSQWRVGESLWRMWVYWLEAEQPIEQTPPEMIIPSRIQVVPP